MNAKQAWEMADKLMQWLGVNADQETFNHMVEVKLKITDILLSGTDNLSQPRGDA